MILKLLYNEVKSGMKCTSFYCAISLVLLAALTVGLLPILNGDCLMHRLYPERAYMRDLSHEVDWMYSQLNFYGLCGSPLPYERQHRYIHFHANVYYKGTREDKERQYLNHLQKYGLSEDDWPFHPEWT